MQVDDPPYLSVGTAVSAKYKGAFCEAKVSKAVHIVKCKVTYKMGLGSATLSDDQIKGTLRVGQLVQAKHPDKKELVDATITKIQDCSQYTVVFDDGDITTLRRTALCLKSGRHFNESETLDQLPLTHPEHFGNPVVGGRRGRRNRQLKEDSSDGEVEEENEPDLEAYLIDIGRVVSVETTEKKRSKDNWFPGLVVIPSAQPTVRTNVKDEYLIRSFKDGRYYTVPKKEVLEFSREIGEKVESSVLAEAVQKALKYLDHNDLPLHWEKSVLFNSQSLDSESDENFTDSSDDEPCEEKDRFVAQLYKFMDDAGTPLNKTPTIATKDIDLHRLFRVVHKLGGYNRVTNQNKWRSVTARLRLPNSQSICNQVKSVYKKCLSSYETFYRTLGVTMLNHTRSNKKNRGRSLIRDKDRTTPMNSPRPEKEEELAEKAEEKKEVPVQTPEPPKQKKKQEVKKTVNVDEVSDTNSSSDTTDQFEAMPGSSKELGRPKREGKGSKEKKVQAVTGKEKVKVVVAEKPEEPQKKEDEEKGQQTRSKSLSKAKDPPSVDKKMEMRVTTRESRTPSSMKVLPKKIPPDEEKKRGRKRLGDEKSSAEGDGAVINVNIGDKLKVYYGPTNESKVTYEAKVIEIDKDQSGPVYLVHYTGWNTRYDEWIQPQRIAENLSATTKAKRLKQNSASNKLASGKAAARRGRGVSITGRSASMGEAPRSTTPSSVTSSSSRTKSPATPATRSMSRLTRQDSTRKARRISAHTDASNHSETESDASASESEVPRTRSASKTEEVEVRTYKRKIVKPATTPKPEKRKEKEDDDTEKEEESEKTVRRTKKVKRSPEKQAAEESEDETNPPKGRDFDLNQIRSELKGFTKAIKVPSIETIEKEMVSSSDDSTNPPTLEIAPGTEGDAEDEKPKEKPLEKESSSEDIYEFKEPEPFEFESRSKMVVDEKNVKKRLVPRIFDELDKSPNKKIMKSPPSKTEKQENPSPERKSFRRTPSRKPDLDISDDEDSVPPMLLSPQREKVEDLFDKLVESPSFNLVKTVDKPVDKSKVAQNLLEESLSLFRELPETVDDYSRDMELSDCESQTQIFTRSADLFSDTFSKSPDRNTLDMEFSSGKLDEGKLKDSDDDDMIRAQIQRAIARSSSTDEDSGEPLLITPPTTSYQVKRRDVDPGPLASILGISTSTQIIEVPKAEEVKEPVTSVPPIEMEEKQELPPPPMEKSAFAIVKQTISPALQETDSALLESIVSQPPVSLNVKLEETAKELSNVKTGTKIADSILQKFNSIKNKMENKSTVEESASETIEKEKVKSEFRFELPKEETKANVGDTSPKSSDVKAKYSEVKPKAADGTLLLVDVKPQPETLKVEIKPSVSPIPVPEPSPDLKKRRRAVSKPYIDESDTDSSDSEQLIIARFDDDSQTNSMDIKLPVEFKESDNSNPFTQIATTTDDSQSQEEPRNFQFDVSREKSSEPPAVDPADELKSEDVEEAETPKEEEPDSHLHSLLLCEEEIPRSPAPATEPVAPVIVKPAKSVLEMPFASAPGTSNSKSMLHLEHKKVHPLPLELPVEQDGRADVSTVLDNTPPTTPESTISTPSGDNGNLSPNMVDNESCKSNDEPEYPRRRNSSMKVSPYSEEDTQMTSDTSIVKKLKEELAASSCKKRRKSLRGSDEATPAKRGRKPMNRSRQNSDSDDTSEHSNTGSAHFGLYDRSARSPRPSKYNFYVEFDPSLDSGQRIAVLQQKLSELRKTYADVKAELAAVERRRKKIRRREREALKAAKQEMACA